MAELQYTGQATMDLYYQQFKANEDFFDIDHFKYLNSVVYSELIQDYYDQSYRKNLAEKGIGDAELPDDLFIIEQQQVKLENGQYELQLKQKPHFFLHDNSYRSVQNIFAPLDSKCKVRLARINSNSVWKLKAKTFPNSSYVFWHLRGDKILFELVKCGLGEVTVQYIPSLGELRDDDKLANSLQNKVIRGTLDLMIAARNGTVVNVTNDQNSNKAMETEIDNLFRAIKTKR